MLKAARFFSESETQNIIEAINSAELDSSGEIRVHLEAKCSLDPVLRAQEIFKRLAMHKTKSRNGILFYLATEDKKFAVIGDQGIHQVVGQEFWIAIKDSVLDKFKAGLFAEGLIKGIEQAGKSLKEFFPYQDGDQNELNNDISIS